MKNFLITPLMLAILCCLMSNARPEGQQVAGPPSPCPFGQTMVRASIGPYTIGEICLSAAELERWFPVAERDGKPLPVRVLILRGK